MTNLPVKAVVAEGSDWITYVETKAPVAKTLVFNIAENTSTEVRSGNVQIVRADDESILKTVELVQKGVPAIHIDGVEYKTIQAAIDAAKDGETVHVVAGTYDEHLVIDGKAVTVQGAGEGTVINSVEIFKAAATVKDLSINVVADLHVAGHEAGYKNTYGVYVHRAGFGATIDNVTINMDGAKSDATGIFLVGDETDTGETYDVIRNSIINGVAGKRNAQIYKAKAKWLDNTVFAGHNDYGIRIGNGYNDVVLDGNTFKTAGSSNSTAIQFNGMSNSTIQLGDNTQDGSFKWLYGANNEWLFTNNNKINAIYGRGNDLIKKSDGLLTKAWGNYVAEGTWVDPTGITTGNGIRNGVITDTRVYLTTNNASVPIAAYNRKTGAYVGAITDGFETGGLWLASGISKMEDGTIIVSNMAREAGAQKTFKLYKFDRETGSVQKIAELETSAGVRLGDKISTYGTWSAGSIFTTNYFVNESGQHVVYEWRVNNGEVTGPFTATMNDTFNDANKSHMASYFVYSGAAAPNGGERFALYAGGLACQGRVGWPGNGDFGGAYGGYWYSHNGDGITQIFETSVNDPHWFWMGGEKYMAYVSAQNPGAPNSGYLRFFKMPAGDTAADKFAAIKSLSNLDAISEKYPASGTTDFNAKGTVNADANGYCDYVNVDGTIYILAGIVGAGVSVFQVN